MVPTPRLAAVPRPRRRLPVLLALAALLGSLVALPPSAGAVTFAITTNPTASVTVVAGGTVTLTADATADTAPTVKWQTSADGIAWADIAGATAKTYAFTASVSGDGLRYRADFSSGGSHLQTTSATVNVLSVSGFSPTSVTTGDAVRIIGTGFTYPLSATFPGNLAVSAPSGDRTSFTVTVPIGTYSGRVTVSSGDATAASSTNLTVNGLPVITTQPASRGVAAGSSTPFAVVAQASPAPTYQWETSTDGTVWTTISGATGASYGRVWLAGDDLLRFRVKVTNSFGMVTSSVAQLVVVSVASFTPTSVSTGDTITIKGSGFTSPATVRFVGPDTAALTVLDRTTGAVTVPGGAASGVVSVTTVDATAASSTSLVVNRAPLIITQPVSRTVILGNTATFSVVVSQDPTPSYQWWAMPDGGPAATISGATSSSYTYTPVWSDNGRRFWVVVTNTLGTATSNMATLTMFASSTTGSTASLTTGTQTISFSMPPSIGLGRTFALTGTATSGLALTYQSITPTVCTVSGAIASALALGTCTIIANQAGNATWKAASAVNASTTILPISTLTTTWLAKGKATSSAPIRVKRPTAMTMRLSTSPSLAGRTAEVWWQIDGGAWTRLTTRKIDANGAASYSFTAWRPDVAYRWRFGGDTTYAFSLGAARRIIAK